MKLFTKYFGEIDYSEQDVISFPKGLFAFENEKEYLLIPFPDSDETLLCLQSTKTPELAFVVMNPFALNPEYAPILQKDELEFLEGQDSHEFCYYVLCVVKDPVSDSTVNLKCPVVINEDKRKAAQVILEGTEYNMRHLLSEFQRTEETVC